MGGQRSGGLLTLDTRLRGWQRAATKHSMPATCISNRYLLSLSLCLLTVKWGHRNNWPAHCTGIVSPSPCVCLVTFPALSILRTGTGPSLDPHTCPK